MTKPEPGDMVRITGGTHRGEVGIYFASRTYGGGTAYLEIHTRSRKKSRKLQINESLVEKLEDEPCEA